MTRIQIPTYEEALERHETPLDTFVSRWEPVDSKNYKHGFREDLAALIAYIESARVAQLEAALTESIDLVRQWHNMDTAGILTKEEHEMMWRIYLKNSPEMKRITAALEGVK